MSHPGTDFWTPIFFVVSALLIVFMTWRGWRLGLVRQALSIVGVVAAYAAGFTGGKFLIPLLRPLGFPDRVLAVFGGILLGLVVYLCIGIFAGLLFKRTAHQSVGVVKWGFGLSGAFLGMIFGVFLVGVTAVAIRILGSLAEHEASGMPAARNPVATRLAEIKQSLEKGTAGAVLAQVDPVPNRVYDTLGKVGRLVSNADSIERFNENPSVRTLSVNPKILALQQDPEIAKAAEAQDFIALLRNPKVVAAANDPEVIKLLSEFDLQKALDFALKPSQKPPGH